jgi:1-acyl-sn-glycerol-3-phosphate acyltransferase
MAAYYRNADATAAVSLPGGWLDSGDLAYRAEGELYIVGRVKDLIIKGGRNIAPEEVEEIAGSIDGVRKGCVAAFGVADPALGTERLVVVAETRVTDSEERARLETTVISRVAEGIGLPPDTVSLVAPGSVLKTSSGKIRRGETKEMFLKGNLGQRPRVPLRRKLALLAGVARVAIRSGLSRAAYALYLAYLALALLVTGPVLWALVTLIPGRRQVFALQRLASRACLRIMGCRLSVEGLEHLRGTGAAILASNHTSYVDVAALLALLPVDFVFVAKKEVLSWPVIGAFTRKARHPTVDRMDPQHSVVAARAVADVVRSGQPVLFFPEGTFTSAVGLRPFRLGAFEVAAQTKAPVVPLAIRGARHVLRGDDWRPRAGHIHVWIGPAMRPQGTTWKDVLDLRNQVADVIAAHCGEPRLDLVVGGLAGV